MRRFLSFSLIGICGCCSALPSCMAQETPAKKTPAQVSYTGRVNALEAIIAVGLETQTPIGIVPGRDTASLCRTEYPFDLREMDAPTALLDIARRTQYSLTQEDGVFILTAPDTTPRQAEVLGHRFKEFKPGTKQTMHMLSAQLEGSLWVEIGHGQGYGGSILDSMDAPRVALPAVLKNTTTKAVANRVVTQGKEGMWISEISPDATNGPDDFYIQFQSYGDPDQLKRELSCKW